MAALGSMVVETGGERGNITCLFLSKFLRSENPQSAYDDTSNMYLLEYDITKKWRDVRSV